MLSYEIVQRTGVDYNSTDTLSLFMITGGDTKTVKDDSAVMKISIKNTLRSKIRKTTPTKTTSLITGNKTHIK